MSEQTFQSRYPHYNVLDKWASPDWDDQTREVVRKRLEEIPPIRFFTHEEAQLLEAIAEGSCPNRIASPERRSRSFRGLTKNFMKMSGVRISIHLSTFEAKPCAT